MRRVVAMLRWLPYPAVLVGAMALAVALLTHGVKPELVSVSAFVFALAVVFGLEWVIPLSPPPRAGTVLSDSVYLLMAAAVQRVVVGALTALWLGLTVWVGGAMASPEQGSLPSRVLAGVSALLLADFVKYWLHRLSHERPALWRFHAAHHAPRRVYSFNGVRIHPVNLGWNLAADTLAALALGLDATTFALVASFRSVVAVLQHADLDVDLRGIDKLLSTPNLHRFHHSTAIAEGNTNYGSTFIVWDTLFGTRFLRQGAPRAIGLANGQWHPDRFLATLVWPWQKGPSTAVLTRHGQPGSTAAGARGKRRGVSFLSSSR